MQEFYSKRGFYEGNFVVTVDVIPANSNQRILGFSFESLENFTHRWFVQRLCISVVKTFGTGFNICEVGIIDFGRWWNQARVLWKLLVPTIGDADDVSGPLLARIR